MADLSFELGEHWHKVVADKVASGEFASPGKAVEHALKAIETDEERLDRVAALLRQGEESGEAIPFDFDAFLAEARRRRDGRAAG